MADEFGEFSERQPKKKAAAKSSGLTLEKAVDMGEYDPQFLATFPQWQGLTNNLRWHYIRQALINRRRFLQQNYAETNNIQDIRLKPEMKKVLDRITEQLAQLAQAEEKLRLEYLA